MARWYSSPSMQSKVCPCWLASTYRSLDELALPAVALGGTNSTRLCAMAPEAWSKKYLALALAALLCFNAFQLCQYLVSRRGSASTVRLLLRSATSESPHAPFDEEGLAEALPKLQ